MPTYILFHVCRNQQTAGVTVDSGPVSSGNSPSGSSGLNNANVLRIGGVDTGCERFTGSPLRAYAGVLGNRFTQGVSGCLQGISVNTGPLELSVSRAGARVQQTACSPLS